MPDSPKYQLETLAVHAGQEQSDLLGAVGARELVALHGALEELVDREAEAEHRQRGADPRHQRAVGIRGQRIGRQAQFGADGVFVARHFEQFDRFEQ